ncbi:MAG TPA: AMP-binding protein, partial [Steroidobacter sp.]|nr:AMP-binding protein [Steroidobacter sp.]
HDDRRLHRTQAASNPIVQYAPSVVANLERSAARFPERCAVQRADVRVSFAALWQTAQHFAGYLQREGLHRGDRVALLLNNSADCIAAIYGTLLAGGIAVTLNAAAKSREFVSWLGHSGAAFLVAEARSDAAEALAQLAPRPRVITVGPDAFDPDLGPAVRFEEVINAAQPPLTRLSNEESQAACILYTSGTTGRPKGVVLTHGNLSSNNAAIVQYLSLHEHDSVLSILPFYYSYGASVLHSHIQCGGRIVLEPNFVYPHLVVENLARQQVSGFAGVPSTFALLLSRVDLRKYDLSTVRYLTQAGGAMSPALTQRLRSAIPSARLYVMYGQTEATARLSYLAPDMLDAKIGSVGVAVPGVQLEIRREDGSTAAPMEIGEVWARGPNIMQGYWRDEAATKAVTHAGWLKTGDLGYQDEDGYLYLAGRRSDIIKTGAHRVHPKDVEEVLQELEQVVEAAVVGVDDELLGQAIAAFVVLAPNSQLDAREIKTHCLKRLASYKVPKSVEFVTQLPKTSSGKVRRIELMERKQS